MNLSVNLHHNMDKTAFRSNEKPRMLLDNKTGKLITAKEADRKIEKKHTKEGFIIGAITGLTAHEIMFRKSNYTSGRKMLHRLLAMALGSLLFTFTSIMENVLNRATNEVPMPGSDKYRADRYKQAGFTPQYKPDELKYSKLDLAMLAIGGTLGAVHTIKRGKIKLPVLSMVNKEMMESAKPGMMDVGATALINAVIYGTIGRAGLYLYDSLKNENNQSKAK